MRRVFRSRRLLVLLVLCLCGLGLSHPVVAGVPTRQPVDAQRGRDLYEDLCWQCHGPAGAGDGPVAAALGMPLRSLSDNAQSTWPALIKLIRDGRGDMPAYAATVSQVDSRRILVWLASLDGGGTKLAPTRSAMVEGASSDDQGAVDDIQAAAPQEALTVGSAAKSGEDRPELTGLLGGPPPGP